jgi:hypothetical protein
MLKASASSANSFAATRELVSGGRQFSRRHGPIASAGARVSARSARLLYPALRLSTNLFVLRTKHWLPYTKYWVLRTTRFGGWASKRSQAFFTIRSSSQRSGIQAAITAARGAYEVVVRGTRRFVRRTWALATISSFARATGRMRGLSDAGGPRLRSKCSDLSVRLAESGHLFVSREQALSTRCGRSVFYKADGQGIRSPSHCSEQHKQPELIIGSPRPRVAAAIGESLGRAPWRS